jgi:hypothetical protein
VNKEGEMAVVWSWWPEERHEREALTTKDYAKALKDIDESSLGLKPLSSAKNPYAMNL